MHFTKFEAHNFLNVILVGCAMPSVESSKSLQSPEFPNKNIVSLKEKSLLTDLLLLTLSPQLIDAVHSCDIEAAGGPTNPLAGSDKYTPADDLIKGATPQGPYQEGTTLCRVVVSCCAFVLCGVDSFCVEHDKLFNIQMAF